MLKIRLAAAGLALAAGSSLLVAFGGFGGTPAQGHPASIGNFACAGAGNVGICVGPPTADSTHPL